MNKRQIGANYEELAKEYLVKHGVTILEQNFRGKYGEVDLIAQEREYLVFVEVKYRKNHLNGEPEEAVTFSKQKRICKTAEYYLYMHGISLDQAVRYDVVAVCGEQVKWYRNAFSHIFH